MTRRGLTPHDIEHSQHRRASWCDYGEPGLYMVTMCIEGRHPLFGELEGDMRAQRGTPAFPHIALSPLGRAIRDEELPKIHRLYPQIELWQATIMPDHLHLLLYIAAPLPDGKKLGDILRSFKGGCSRAWWAQEEGNTKPALTAAGMAAGTTAGTAATTAKGGTALKSAGTTAGTAGGTEAGTATGGTALKSAGTEAGTEAGTAAGTAAGTTAGTAAGTAAGTGAAVPVLSSTVNRPSLFEPGYHDRIIKRPGMLENIKRYMADNPLRAVMRRALPGLLERRLHLRVGSHDYAAFGCLFLLKRPEKEQVFYHRKDKQTGMPTETTAAYAAKREQQLNEAREGVVLVSPAISKGERLVINAAIDEGLPVIHLQKEPISSYWKPERRRFEACACGNLLILAPWGLDEDLTTTGTATPSDFARFHHLNDLAAEICNTTEAVLMRDSF